MALRETMAQLIPDTLPASSTAGERRVFAALARLPDDCLIYYEPVVRRRCPDLIAILAEVGVVVIEVKKDLAARRVGERQCRHGDDHAAWYRHGCSASAPAGARIHAAADG